MSQCPVGQGFVEVEGVLLLSSLAGRQQQARCGVRPAEQIKVTQLSRAELSGMQSGALSSYFPAVLCSAPELGIREKGNEKKNSPPSA